MNFPNHSMKLVGKSKDRSRMGASAMRKLNGALLLEIIREQGRISRAELARASRLTKPTVSSQVADLIELGIVVEDGAGEPDERGGKPPKLLRFNSEWGGLVAAEISTAGIRVWYADLDGNRLDSEHATFPAEMDSSQVLNLTCDAIDALLRRGRQRKQKLRAMAVAAPGRVDARSGTVLEAGIFHWHDVPVMARIQRAFRVPVLVDNDVNLAALGEMHAGLAQGVDDFVLIRLGTGIGAGVVLGRQLYRGSHWAAGEIGHMIFDRSALADEAIERGHLELAIGGDRVRERMRKAAAGRIPADAATPGAHLASRLSEAMLLDDPVAAGVLEEVAAQLGVVVADMAATLDPELIVLAGEMFDLLTDRIKEFVGRVIPWPVRIERSALGEDAALMGAIGSARAIAHELLCDLDRG